MCMLISLMTVQSNECKKSMTMDTNLYNLESIELQN